MFKVLFVKHVFDANSADPKARFAVLTREEELPFAPVPGHEIVWPLERSLNIISSSWNCEKQSFTCRVGDEYTVSLNLDAPEFEEVLAEAPETGWRVAQVYPATP